MALDHAVLEVGGVGLRVAATPTTLSGLQTGRQGRLATSLVVREDSLTLYGFETEDQRDIFELVQTVSGVGPRLAMAILAVHSPDGLRAAVSAQDLNALCKVPGIGRKGAQRLVLELADKLTGPSAVAPAAGVVASSGADAAQVVSALVGLGWTAKVAEPAVEAVMAQDPDADVATVLRAALRSLGRA